jgi:hypothetical protein
MAAIREWGTMLDNAVPKVGDTHDKSLDTLLQAVGKTGKRLMVWKTRGEPGVKKPLTPNEQARLDFLLKHGIQINLAEQ